VTRYASVDALRGLTVAAMLLVNTPGDWGHVYAPLRHAAWHGCTFADLVFPCFLFVVGVSVSLGIAVRAERGAAVAGLRHDALLRALRIVALGLVLHAVAMWATDAAWFRPWGVLQRIGLCFAVCALCALHLRPRGQWWLIAALLLGYWLLLAGTGGFEPWTNLANRIDAAMLGPHAYMFDPATRRAQEPEGLLSTLPAIAGTLVGLRAGDWLRSGQVVRLWLAGAAMLAAGALWSLALPLNKPLWTPSYVLWSSGWATLALAALHVVIDRRGWPPVGRSLGINAIAVYVGAALMVYALIAFDVAGPLYDTLFAGWMRPRFGPYLPSLAFAVAFVALWWGVAVLMRRRGWRITV
jgi:predicted acyltransferase